MTDTILSTRTLPETLLRLIQTDKVRLIEESGDFRIIPLREGSGLMGLGIGRSNLTTEKFLEYKREESEIEKRKPGL
jgi:hypothetical protein